MQAKSIYYNNNKCKDFVFEHCWPILQYCEKFSNPPSNFAGPTFSPPIELDDDGTPSIEVNMAPSSSRQPRPPGQKAQKASKKKAKQDNGAIIRLQMERYGDLADREFTQRQLMMEEARAAEERSERRADERERRAEQRAEEAQKRAEDAHTMQVDLRIFTPNKRSFWERKQQHIINMQRQNEDSAPNHPQVPTPSEGPSSDVTAFVPLHNTHWIPSNEESP